MEAILNKPVKETGTTEDPLKITLYEESELQSLEENEKMLHYLPEIQKPHLIAQVEKEYEHMLDVRRQVRERKREND